ncbi:MAG: Ni/Fe hydrogenase subunit alpha [Nanoarchaeota archaeon]
MKEITLNHITKIEGHAKLTLKIDKSRVIICELGATEGARYFEGLVMGRHYYEAHEMTSRICGICSCAHVVCAIQGMEDALGVIPSAQTVELRKLLTLGERIRSHATHLYFLALPDYVGYESALAMAKEFKPELKRALHMMKVGNHIIKTLAARDLHPVSATVGGWLKLPRNAQLKELHAQVESLREDAVATVELFSGLSYPDFESKGESFSLSEAKEYAMLSGSLISGEHHFDKDHYLGFIREYHHDYSSANFVVRDDHRYMVGALPRMNNNGQQLCDAAKSILKKTRFKLPSSNPYHNVMAQAIELVHCIDHAVDILKNLTIQDEKLVAITPKVGRGVGVIEVPRGTLWHEYQLDKKGIIRKANIITPTAQNLLNIQEDIREFVPTILKKSKKDMIMDIEKLIRSYDPCFSCSAHFLEVNWR